MKPVKINKTKDNILLIIWDDEHESKYPLQFLRDFCPCATCQGETVLFKTYKPEKMKFDLPGKYELKNIQTVGNYAIQLIWNDGHDTGIYSWEYLRKICQCDNCNKD
jgi:DUF971 family protein